MSGQDIWKVYILRDSRLMPLGLLILGAAGCSGGFACSELSSLASSWSPSEEMSTDFNIKSLVFPADFVI